MVLALPLYSYSGLSPLLQYCLALQNDSLAFQKCIAGDVVYNVNKFRGRTCNHIQVPARANLQIKSRVALLTSFMLFMLHFI